MYIYKTKFKNPRGRDPLTNCFHNTNTKPHNQKYLLFAIQYLCKCCSMTSMYVVPKKSDPHFVLPCRIYCRPQFSTNPLRYFNAYCSQLNIGCFRLASTEYYKQRQPKKTALFPLRQLANFGWLRAARPAALLRASKTLTLVAVAPKTERASWSFLERHRASTLQPSF